MAWPGTLTEEEQDIVTVFTDQLDRAAFVRLVQALNLCNGAHEEWTNRVSALFGKLAADDVIPNTGGLAGSEALTKAEWTTLLGWMDDVLTDHSTTAKRTGYARAIGAVNMMGE
jgi:hypothetical protein